MIKYTEGNVVNQPFAEPTCVPHIVNNRNLLGSGLAWNLARRWPEVKYDYHNWYQNDDDGCGSPFQLGQVQFLSVTSRVIVANMIAQSIPHGETINGIYVRPIRLDSLYECMLRVGEFCKRKNIKNIMSGKFGGLRAGANFEEEIVPLIESLWSDFDVTIFEYKE